jgi:HD-like signal output (HDOD) protein
MVLSSANNCVYLKNSASCTTYVLAWSGFHSPLYAYTGIIYSIRESISRVLGINFVFNLALGLSTLVSLKAPKEAPIGTRLFWVNAMA